MAAESKQDQKICGDLDQLIKLQAQNPQAFSQQLQECKQTIPLWIFEFIQNVFSEIRPEIFDINKANNPKTDESTSYIIEIMIGESKDNVKMMYSYDGNAPDNKYLNLFYVTNKYKILYSADSKEFTKEQGNAVFQQYIANYFTRGNPILLEIQIRANITKQPTLYRGMMDLIFVEIIKHDSQVEANLVPLVETIEKLVMIKDAFHGITCYYGARMLSMVFQLTP